MKYLLIQFLLIFVQSSFGANYEPILENIDLQSGRLAVIKSYKKSDANIIKENKKRK